MFLVIYFIVTSEYLYHHGISYTWLYYTRSKKGVIVIKKIRSTRERDASVFVAGCTFFDTWSSVVRSAFLAVPVRFIKRFYLSFLCNCLIEVFNVILVLKL